jgi:hypothetical protein
MKIIGLIQTVLYETEFWNSRRERAELHVRRGMAEYLRADSKENVNTRENADVVNINIRTVDFFIRWFANKEDYKVFITKNNVEIQISFQDRPSP